MEQRIYQEYYQDRHSMSDYTAIDVFAGCGGLSLGAHRAGFNVQVALENEPVAAKTFRHNHPATHVIEEDVRKVSSNDIVDLLVRERVDLLMGCAPCQGFCSLTRKAKRQDPRNQLLLEMARLIEELEPRAVIMENVSGLETRGKKIFQEFLGRLDAAGYISNYAVVQMADYGVPQNRRRLLLLAGRGFPINLPKPTHSRTAKPAKQPWRSVRDTIGHLMAPVTLKDANNNGGPTRHNWHVVRNLQPQTKARLKAAVPGKTWKQVDESLRPSCHQDGYVGFTNTYGRMTWDEIAPTITGGCTTPAKGRFGHPDNRRYTISVREAALLQTFPEDYEFVTEYIEPVCQMIGNAVPPNFAEVLVEHVMNTLKSLDV